MKPAAQPLACAALALACALLTACGSAPQRQAAGREPAAATAPQSSAPRPGGYYLDDGPDDRALPDPDSIADAVPRAEPLHRYANHPYTVFGQDYKPMRALAPYRQRGLASWYGRRYHGQNTSSGEPYDMRAMTAAHPTLPIPSYARVTRVDNGKSVVVRINDRGPFRSGRIIDLSYTAAHKLGILKTGSMQVEVELVRPGDAPVVAERIAEPGARRSERLEPVAPPVPALREVPARAERASVVDGSIPITAEMGGVFLQLGAFSARANAETLRERIYSQLGRLDRAIEILQKDGLFRLHLGPYRDRAEADGIARRIAEALELRPVIVVR